MNGSRLNITYFHHLYKKCRATLWNIEFQKVLVSWRVYEPFLSYNKTCVLRRFKVILGSVAYDTQ